MSWITIMLVILLTALLMIPGTLATGNFLTCMSRISSEEVRSLLFLQTEEALAHCRQRLDKKRKLAIKQFCFQFGMLFSAYILSLGIIFFLSWLLSMAFGG